MDGAAEMTPRHDGRDQVVAAVREEESASSAVNGLVVLEAPRIGHAATRHDRGDSAGHSPRRPRGISSEPAKWSTSKGSRDAFVWAAGKGFFPVHVTRRYLVLAWRWCERAELLDQGKEVLTAPATPFGIETINWSRELPTQRPR